MTLGQLDVREDLPKIEAPTLVVHQRNDYVTPFDSARRIAALIPNATLCPLPGDNHWMLLDEPGGLEFVRMLDDFLTGSAR